jgi:hypothetical protein
MLTMKNTNATCRLSSVTSTGKSKEVEDMTRGDTSMNSQRKKKQQWAYKT